MRSRLGSVGEAVPCVRCDRREVGLAWGDHCSVCRDERDGRAARIARRAAILGALVMAAGLLWQGLLGFKARLFGAASVLLVYVILRRLVTRAVLELARRGDLKAEGRHR